MTTLAGAPLAPSCSAVEAQAARVPAQLAYRSDVDGLRAVAVLAVVLFHFFPSVLPGGFVGVDIFFVISGYLISRIILWDLQKDRFSFAGFYGRRIRRIFPALILVMAAALAFGWTALLRAEYARLGEHATAGAAFVSNLLLWSESGYFDQAAVTKPFLHLWSLGVEEQFYLLWPVVLGLAWRLRFNLLFVVAGLGLLSFAANVVATSANPVEAFYSPLTRFWELMVGAMLASGEMQRRSRTPDVAGPGAQFAARPRLASLASLLGGALIALSAVFAHEKGFPGWQAVAPTAGAGLLIFAGPHGPVNRMLLSRPPMVLLGLVSYPLYLWHWPLFSFARIVHGELGTGMRAMLLAIALILAALTYRLIEQPVKTARRRGGVTLLLALLMAAIGGAGVLLTASNGVEQREVVRANVDLGRWQGHRYPPFTGECSFVPAAQKHLFQCHTDLREPPRFALLGDSKAGALFPGLFRTSQRGGTWVFLGSGKIGPLLPVLGDNPIYSYVDATAVEAALRTIERTKSVETVVVAVATRALFGLKDDRSIGDLPRSRHYEAALDGLDASISRLVAAGKRVVLLVDNPTLPHMEDCIARKTGSSLFNHLLQAAPNPDCRLTVAAHLELSRPYRDLLDALQRRHPADVSLFDTIPILCPQGLCAPTRDGQFLYGVTDHISDHASELVGAALNARLRAEDAAGRQRRGRPPPQ